MPKRVTVQAWQCEWCDENFAVLEDAQEHEGACAYNPTKEDCPTCRHRDGCATWKKWSRYSCNHKCPDWQPVPIADQIAQAIQPKPKEINADSAREAGKGNSIVWQVAAEIIAAMVAVTLDTPGNGGMV